MIRESQLVVSMIVRNEAGRYLESALQSASDAVEAWGAGSVRVVDDCSDDNTADMCRRAGAEVRVLDEPTFWRHEGEAREQAYRWTHKVCDAERGDWIVVLDGDETLSRPETLKRLAGHATRRSRRSVAFPLYEFWTAHSYRVDGLWHGSYAKRMFRYQRGGRIPLVEFAGPNVPGYAGRPLNQDDCHLLHWGYARAKDRKRKQAAYMARPSGHGHLDGHIMSITAPATLRRYQWSR